MNITTNAGNGGPWEWWPLGIAAWYHGSYAPVPILWLLGHFWSIGAPKDSLLSAWSRKQSKLPFHTPYQGERHSLSRKCDCSLAISKSAEYFQRICFEKIHFAKTFIMAGKYTCQKKIKKGPHTVQSGRSICVNSVGSVLNLEPCQVM